MKKNKTPNLTNIGSSSIARNVVKRIRVEGKYFLIIDN